MTRRRVVLFLMWLRMLWPLGVEAQSVQGSVQVRTRVENWRWFESSAHDAYTYWGTLVRAAAHQQRPRLGWRIELAAPLLIGLPADAIAPAPQGAAGLGPSYWLANDSATNVAGLFLKQAFLRIGALPAAGVHSLRLGRFEFIDGMETVPRQTTLAALERERIAHRLVGNFGWSHVQRSFDGLHYTYDDTTVNVTAAALRATRGVFDANGWPGLDVGVAYAALNRRALTNQRSDWRIFGLYYRDSRTDPVPLKVDNRALSARQADADPIGIVTLGGHYVRVIRIDSTSIDLLGWAALQAGRWGTLTQRAYAGSLEAGWQPPATWQPWLRAGFTYSSGDDTPDDDDHGTFFQVLPTPRLYARFPFYNLMNVQDAFVSLQVRPSGPLQLRTELHSLRLASSRDLWYSGGGAFEPLSFGYAGRPANAHSLATLIDLSAELRLNTQLIINGYIGFARGQTVIDRIYPDGSNGLLGYLELEWRRP